MAREENVFIAEVVNVENQPMGDDSLPNATGTLPAKQNAIGTPGNRKYSARAQSMFRASPWVSYDPSADYRNQGQPTTAAPPSEVTMLENVDMDAPHISTLRDEDSPPPPVPNPTRTSKFRVRLLVNEGKGSSSTNKLGAKRTEEEHDDEEEEEDQLIDDDEGANRHSESPSKRKSISKKKPKRGDQLLEDKAKMLSSPFISEQAVLGDGAVVRDPVQSSSRKKASPRKAPSKPKGKAAKLSKNLSLPNLDDPANLSEGYTGTAASSPLTIQPDLATPEPEHAFTPIPPLQAADDYTPDITPPFPIYPLPSKPFPVQPPSKISSGFAPVIPLAKSRERVRHWRPANREIRGIAGGRWFSKTWVGDKESAYASHLAAKAAAADSEKQGTPTLTLPKVPAIPSGKAKTKLSKSHSAPSAAASVGPSRSGSVVPESQMPAATRPTGMDIE